LMKPDIHAAVADLIITAHVMPFLLASAKKGVSANRFLRARASKPHLPPVVGMRALFFLKHEGENHDRKDHKPGLSMRMSQVQ